MESRCPSLKCSVQVENGNENGDMGRFILVFIFKSQDVVSNNGVSPEFIFNDGSINEKARNLQYVTWINFVNSNQKSTLYFLCRITQFFLKVSKFVMC